MPNQIELSIIILCYRSEEAIVEFADRTRKLAEELTNNFEIILVANFFEDSGDRTGDIVKEIAEKNSRYRVVSKPKKGMMGWDMKEGLDIASGKYLCVIDGDGQFPIESIAHCFREIKTEKYGLVKIKPGSGDVDPLYVFPDVKTGEFKKGKSWINPQEKHTYISGVR